MRIALLLLIAFAAVSVRADDACEPTSLRILLTNDDGYDTPGITALHSALMRSGHRVKRVAPEANYSGSSASVTFDVVRAPRVPIGEFSEVYAVSASPATTVLLGATALFTPQAHNRQAAENHAHVANVAAFVARLVRELQCAPTDWFSQTTALNVNYPPLAPKDIKGVRVAEQGAAPYFNIGFEAIGEDRFAPSFGAVPTADELPRADTMLFNDGYITVVPIDGNYTASGATLPVSLELLAP